jgi:hypothetical protein
MGEKASPPRRHKRVVAPPPSGRHEFLGKMAPAPDLSAKEPEVLMGDIIGD